MNIPDYAPSIRVADFTYNLPADRIAQHPVEQRDASRLLVLRRAEDVIEHRTFHDVVDLLPENSTIIVNKSKVVAARLILHKPTGGIVEVLLTSPVAPSTDPAVVLRSNSPSEWQCLIGGKNVIEGMKLTHDTSNVGVIVTGRNGTEGTVRIEWDQQKSLAEMLNSIGHIPLPPYMRRADETDDKHRYQTVYAEQDGSVAAPTAGLHFTEGTLSGLSSRGIKIVPVTLHVGLGTFKPLDVEDLRQHEMHKERIEFTLSSVNAILSELRKENPHITCVGTTSMRTLESIHWLGAQLIGGKVNFEGEIGVDQWSAFNPEMIQVRSVESLSAVRDWMIEHDLASLQASTQLLIAPGARIAATNSLITNFHQPGNTLLMLVAAFAGPRGWRKMYDVAIEDHYRMLSYGDASLITT